MKILVAGPGTGKTSKIHKLIEEAKLKGNILVLSFTNATINDLMDSFSEKNLEISANECMTLHKCAIKLRSAHSLQIVDNLEAKILDKLSKKYNTTLEDLCRILRCITYDQMIEQTIRYIQANPIHIQNRLGQFELLIVDEYQDFNDNERKLIELISNHAKETIVLGDDDQSIYEFKDATVDAIIKLYSESEKLSHENICYRCPDTVVNACNNLIRNNKTRIEKEWKCNGNPGEVFFKQISTQVETSKYILEKIRIIKQKEPDSSILLLSPIKLPIEQVTNQLDENNIQYSSLWSENLPIDQRMIIWEIKSLLGSHKILNLIFLLDRTEMTSYKRCKYYKILEGQIAEGISEADFIDALRKLSIFDEKFLDLVLSINEVSTIIEIDKYSIIKDQIDPSQNIDIQLSKIAQEIKDQQIFDKKGITIMSIYKSKGLQADYVFILGLVNGIIPSSTLGSNSIEMQRRLLFVGSSRAKKSLFVISTILWDGRDLKKGGLSIDCSKFQYNYKLRKHEAETSDFISEMGIL